NDRSAPWSRPVGGGVVMIGVGFPRFARVGGRPPIPPECRRTGVVSGSRPSKNQDRSRIASGRSLPPTTYHLPLATPSLRSGGGTTPHTPRVSAYRRRQWVAPVKEPGPFADRVGSLPTTYHLPPTTYHFRLPIGEHEPIPVACSCSPRSSFPANCPSS